MTAISKKIKQISILGLFLSALLANLTSLKAQRTQEDRDKESAPTTSKSDFTSRLWYGGGFTLGLNGFGGNSNFGIGISPMVGYNIWGPFSIGPRVGINYNHQRNNPLRYNIWSIEPGLFARAKIWRGIFAHAEQSLTYWNIKETSRLPNQTYTETTNNTFVGLGLNQGNGGWGTDIYVLYNFGTTSDVFANSNPFTIRFGFTYKF